MRVCVSQRGGEVGVLYDYFRTPDDAAVRALMDRLDGGPVVVGAAGP
jgi:hypothetical protein